MELGDSSKDAEYLVLPEHIIGCDGPCERQWQLVQYVGRQGEYGASVQFNHTDAVVCSEKDRRARVRGRHNYLLSRRDGYLLDGVAGKVHHVDVLVVRGEGGDRGWAQGSVRVEERLIGEEGAP